MGYAWDERKNALNLRKHGIDFSDAVGIFDDLVVTGRSKHLAEERLVAIGRMEPYVITVVCTPRGANRRIISARRARRAERQIYEARRHELATLARDDGEGD